MPRASIFGAITLLAGLAVVGCDSLPGKPRPANRERLPSQVMAFAALYGDNCAACHGADGRLGASRPLNDPLYLALVPRARIRSVIADGVPGTLQPAFAQGSGGTLTDPQIDALVDGLLERWGGAKPLKLADIPPYAAPAGNAARGNVVYTAACAGCHGANGKLGQNGGAITDTSYLSLVSDQYLRTTVIAGRIDLGMPDWRNYTPGQPLTARQISDVVAWLIAQRRPVPGRPHSAKEG
jgi:cytochrome c oxidase cbb3-type subunit 3/ubiquinol-cytochrome c reductase cytochrome c subunit